MQGLLNHVTVASSIRYASLSASTHPVQAGSFQPTSYYSASSGLPPLVHTGTFWLWIFISLDPDLCYYRLVALVGVLELRCFRPGLRVLPLSEEVLPC